MQWVSCSVPQFCTLTSPSLSITHGAAHGPWPKMSEFWSHALGLSTKWTKIHLFLLTTSAIVTSIAITLRSVSISVPW